MGRARRTARGALLAVFLAASHRQAGAADSLSAVQALSLPFTSRSTGLNGAFSAVPGALSSMNFNPAGLYVLEKARASQATAMFSPVGSGGTEEALGYARTVRKAVLAAGALEYGDSGAKPGSGVLARNAAQAVLDAAFPLGHGIWGGAQARAIAVDSFQNGDAAGFDAGAGLLWDSPVEGLTLGAALLNAGPALEFSRARVELPRQERAGAAYAWRYPFGIPLLVLATADGVKPQGSPLGELSGLQIAAESASGIQTIIEGGLALAGTSHAASLGFGMAYKARWTFDCSLTLDNGALSPLSTFTLGWRFF